MTAPGGRWPYRTSTFCKATGEARFAPHVQGASHPLAEQCKRARVLTKPTASLLTTRCLFLGGLGSFTIERSSFVRFEPTVYDGVIAAIFYSMLSSSSGVVAPPVLTDVSFSGTTKAGICAGVSIAAGLQVRPACFSPAVRGGGDHPVPMHVLLCTWWGGARAIVECALF